MAISTYQREITPGASDAYLRRITKDGSQIDLAQLTRVDIEFENVEVVSLRPDAIRCLWVAGVGADNFYLRIPATEASVLDANTHEIPRLAEPGIERLKRYQDITEISLVSGEQKQVLSVHWSALSPFDQENFAQHFAHVDDDLVLCARLPQSYPMAEVVRAANYTENRLVLIDTLNETIDMLHGRAAEFLDTVLDELRSFEGLAEFKDQHLFVRYHDDHWDPVYRLAGDDEDYGGVEFLSYAELMGMDIAIEGPDFWKGFADLLWWVTFYGMEANRREVGLVRFAAEFKASNDETAAFDAAIAKMQRFLDWYAQHHAEDRDVAAVIEQFQPLTDGVVEHWDDDDPDSMEMHVMKQDENLLADFMQAHGEEYKTFE